GAGSTMCFLAYRRPRARRPPPCVVPVARLWRSPRPRPPLSAGALGRRPRVVRSGRWPALPMCDDARRLPRRPPGGDGGRADGAVAMHAGVEDHLVRDELLGPLLPRSIRYAVATRRMRRELAANDEVTSLPTLRGFAPIAEHHLRMADRAGNPVVFVFVRVEEHDSLQAALGREAADELARDAAGVVLDSVRDSDVPGRIAPDTF